MGYRNKIIGTTKGGLGRAECSAASEKLLPRRRPQNGQKTLEGTLEKRSTSARGIGQRFVSMYSTENDGGVVNSQRVGEGVNRELGFASQACQKAKSNAFV
jgi:hypothetical protein